MLIPGSLSDLLAGDFEAALNCGLGFGLSSPDRAAFQLL
jgi:hypothetical protein